VTTLRRLDPEPGEEPTARRTTRTAVAVVPGVVALMVLVFFASSDGGYPPTVWYPGALLLLALVVATGIAYRPFLAGVEPAVVVSIALLGAFTSWTYLTIVWAGVKGDAWDGANRTLLYLIVFALFALLPWRTTGAAIVLGGYSLAVAALGGLTFLQAAAAEDPSGFFVGGRYADPVGYSNANCALFLIAFWPALFLSMRRETVLPLRGVFLAAAGLLLELALLPQSRGSLFAFPIVALVYLLLVPGRLRSGIALASVASAAVATREPLLHLYAVAESDAAGPALADARRSIAISVAALFVAGSLIALADRRLRLSARTSQRISQAAGVLALVAAVAAIVFLVGRYGNPVTRAERAWSDFKAGQPQSLGATRFTGGLGSNRYDFWRVGVEQFRVSPIVGAGADNFAAAYLRRRESDEEPNYPHSLEIQMLGQTGVVGAALLAGAGAFALAAGWRARRARRSFGWALTTVALVAFLYWFTHASVDWFWEIPALTGPALALLGLAAGMSRPPIERPPPSGRTVATVAVLALPLAVVAAVSLVAPWLAARNIVQAAGEWRDDPAAAFSRLERARALNPLSERPDLIAGAIAMRLNDLGRARTAFERALERSPGNWYAELELGIIAALNEDRRTALSHLARAKELNPHEPLIDGLRRQVRRGEMVSPGAVSRLFLQRLEARTS
jgi:hypothetical protein